MKILHNDTIPRVIYIDSLRGIAIILVIICHVAQPQKELGHYAKLIFSFGRIGVQLFFFLSAYTLCLSMKLRGNSRSLVHFYIRRYFRIAPLYYTGILIYMCYNFFLLYTKSIGIKNYSYTSANIVYNIFFIHGLIPAANNTIVPGGWSIGTEMLFYLSFPFLFIRYSKSTKNVRLIIPLIALLIANIFIVFCHYILGYDTTLPFYYYHILTQLPVFLVGMTYFFLEEEISRYTRNWFTAMIIIFTLAFISLVMINIPSMQYVRSIGVFAAAIAFCVFFTLVKSTLRHVFILQKIGQLSFSIYIVHFLFCGALLKILVKYANNCFNTYLVFLFSLIITLSLSFLLALFMYEFVEKPGIRLGKRLISFIKS